MRVLVLGTGCARCKKLYAEAEKAIAESGADAQLGKVERIDEIMRYGVMTTPALVVDEDVVSSGRIPTTAEIVRWITTPSAKTR